MLIKKFWPVGLVALFLLFAGILAITQETEEEPGLNGLPLDDIIAGFTDGEEGEGEAPAVWMPPGPPRWFRSNAGGMMLEEIPSRLAALRNKYALVIDYIPPDEIEPRLLSYYRDEYIVEVRILYDQGAEFRRQWLFRDESGAARLNAVFVPPAAAVEEAAVAEQQLAEQQLEEQPVPAEQGAETESAEIAAEDETEIDIDDNHEEIAEVIDEEPQEPPAPANREAPASVGFIEIFNEKTQITEERQFFDDDSEALIVYSYNDNILIMAEAREKPADGEFRLTYVDYYRYNRSYSLRHVERQFHDTSSLQPVRLTFPGRVLDAAFDENFLSDKLTIISDFLSGFSAGEGYRLIYHADDKGRILSQTMLNDKDEEVWTMINTWLGDRIIAMRKIEGEDEKVTEYEYNSEGNRIVQRDIHNGVLERLVRTDGNKETEELYLDGILVLKAYWVEGRKVSEERVKRR